MVHSHSLLHAGIAGESRSEPARSPVLALLHWELSAVSNTTQEKGGQFPLPKHHQCSISYPQLHETLEALCTLDSKKQHLLPSSWEGTFPPNKGQDPDCEARGI